MAFWLAQTPAASIVESLTERELAVLELLPTHLSTQEISRELFVSVNTIRTQVRAIYRKLRSIAEATPSPRPASSACSPATTSRDQPHTTPGRRPNPWPRSS